MTKYWQGALIGFLAALLFVFLNAIGAFSSMENGFYDIFLRFRPKRERTDLVVFLDVDNQAIAANGVFPWPRSVMADGLLRLKEYGAAAVIFDIEYVDKGPQGVDTVFLRMLPSDFSRTFSEINSSMGDLINSLLEGRLSVAEVSRYLSAYIEDEHRNLLEKALGVARDNDEYLSRASALFGNSWGTLNLRSYLLEGEQASRRILAEELFSYPVNASGGIKNDVIADVLPPIPSFARSVKGAGFTRAHVDGDGVRRRINLVQEFNGYWYLQLAFAALADSLGRPAIDLEKDKLVLRDAVFSDGTVKDIVIPLDALGCMLLDWPLTNYEESFLHFSFAILSRLEQAQTDIELLVSNLSASENIYAFVSRDAALAQAPFILYRAGELIAAAAGQRSQAVAESSEEAFARYLALRGEAWELLYRFRDLDFADRIGLLEEDFAREFPAAAEVIREESALLQQDARSLVSSLEIFDDISQTLDNALRGKMCIVGQTDAGTTDIGVNPFHNQYVNVGTQGVVLDTILSESFIVWLSPRWGAVFCILTPLLILLFSGFAPGVRFALGFLSALLALMVSFFLFRFSGIFLSPVCPVFSLVTAAVIREIAAYAVSDREKQFLRKAFSTYVSDDVVKEIIADPSSLQLGGTKRHMSAVFTDIRDFTGIAEKLDPEDLVRLLNRYLTVMSDVILKEKGTIDKYEGDAIIAFFRAPIELPDHALRACLSAVAIKRAEADLNHALGEQNLSPIPIVTRIGINTGSMVAGNMGTENKMNYTIMGNTVNLASRLEGVNKLYDTCIVVSRATLDETSGRFLARRLDRIRVVGIHEPVEVFELMETVETATDRQRETALRFEKALALFEQREWQSAAAAFRQVLEYESDDGPSCLYMKRCESCLEAPPPEDWDGVFNLDEK